MRRRDAGTALNHSPFDSNHALALDAADPLAGFADEFHHPFDADGRKLLYLCGHSLGLQPKAAAQYVEEELADWRRLGVLGHEMATRPWIEYHEHAAAPLANLVNSDPTEVVAMNSLTVNLHLMMVSFFRPQGRRNRVLIEGSAFPSDRYAVASQLLFHGLDPATHMIEISPRAGERILRTEDLIAQIESQGAELAMVLLPGVQYLTGQSLDLEALIAAARGVGAKVGVDLAHSIGNTTLRMHDWNADFAIWCSYKYLNAGPGAIAGCFVHQRHAQNPVLPRLAGWWGHDKAARFLFEPRFKPIAGAEGWQLSNPPILSAAPLLASLDIFERAGMAALQRKSLALTGFMRNLIQEQLPQDVEIITPAAPGAFGCQLSLRIVRPADEARRCQRRLTDAGVIGDWREPDVLRLAPIPLYNSFSDVFAAVNALTQAVRG